MAAFAAWNSAALAFVLISIGGRLAAADESFVRANKVVKDFTDSEVLTSAAAFELERKLAEARPVVEVSKENVERNLQEGKLEVIESASQEDADAGSHEISSEDLRQPWPGEKLYQHKDNKIVWSVEKKPPYKRILLDNPNISTSHDKLNTSSLGEGDQTKDTHPNMVDEDHPKGVDTIGNDTKKETKQGADNATNPSDISNQGINNSSESDVSGDSSSGSVKHKSCCEDGKKLRACLYGAGAEELTLFVNSYESFHVSLKTPPFLMADRTELELSSGQEESVKIHLVNLEAVRNVNSSEISLTYEAGRCSIDVPAENLGMVLHPTYFYGFPYTAVTTPIVGFGMLFAGLVLFLGIWLWCKYRGGHRHGDGLKYQELEMGHPSVVDHREEANGWDEVWDDTWEDTEATRSSSRLTETLSSKGLAPRKSNKETWEKWSD